MARHASAILCFLKSVFNWSTGIPTSFNIPKTILMFSATLEGTLSVTLIFISSKKTVNDVIHCRYLRFRFFFFIICFFQRKSQLICK